MAVTQCEERVADEDFWIFSSSLIVVVCWLKLICFIEIFLSPWPTLRHCLLSKVLFGVLVVRLLSLHDLREGAESNRYWACWARPASRSHHHAFLFPHFAINDVWSLHRYSILLSLWRAEQVLEGAQRHPPQVWVCGV